MAKSWPRSFASFWPFVLAKVSAKIQREEGRGGRREKEARLSQQLGVFGSQLVD